VSKRWRLLGSVILVTVLAWRVDWAELARAFAGLDLRLWLLAAGCYLLAQGVSSLRWQLLADALGHDCPWHRYLAYYFLGLFFNLVLPTSVGGDVVRAWYLGREKGQKVSAFLSVFADRASGLMVLIALACVAASCSPVPLPPWLSTTVIALGAGTLLGLACLPLLPRLERLPRIGSHLVEGSRIYLRRPRLLVLVALLSLAVQVINVVLVWLIGKALRLPVPLIYYGVLMPLVTLLTLLPISLNGMGLRELGTVVLLAPLGVDSAHAVTLSVLQFAAFGAVSLLGGGVYLLGRFPRLAAGKVEQMEEPKQVVRDAA
jgi:uncharacterized membrane protein YbhN (UPF0104 family)